MDPSQFTPEQLAYQQATFNESTAWEIYTTSIVGIVVAVGTTIMRFFARRYRKADLKSDDWLMVLAVLSFTGLAAIRLKSTAEGASGRHIWAVPPELIPSFSKDVIAYSALFAVTVSILRASILMLYTRLFPVSGSFTAQVWILHILNISYAIVAVICFPLQCIPLAKVWTPTLPGRCMDVTRLLLSTVITTIVLDLAVFLLPIPILLRLQMSVTRKLALCGVFLMGTGVCFVSIYRVTLSEDYVDPDATWSVTLMGHLSIIESFGGILCANATVSWPLIASPLKKLKSSVSSMRKNSSQRTQSDRTAVGEPRSWPSGKSYKSDSDIKLKNIRAQTDITISSYVDTNSRPDDVEALIEGRS